MDYFILGGGGDGDGGGWVVVRGGGVGSAQKQRHFTAIGTDG